MKKQKKKTLYRSMFDVLKLINYQCNNNNYKTKYLTKIEQLWK